jgi:hypothetical protein
MGRRRADNCRGRRRIVRTSNESLQTCFYIFPRKVCAEHHAVRRYCNIYPALRDSFCPAEGCNGPDTASKCWNHYETRGKEEGKIYPCLQQCYLG